ncbi:PC-Esterase [Cynara cardunculus var. scolymus]|uniref:PC-Esterase n=1 Tax=Cynara cardunculus var. scolymus TaxID=59895 RepID=A0A103XQ55_CYNCS|nr:PC-Esterase [Cynara cardunculus var. scolymus]
MEKLQKLLHGYHSSVGFMLLMGVIIGVVYFCGGGNNLRFEVIGEAEMAEDYSFEGCDFFNGSWVYDNKSRPLYKEKQFNGTALLEKLRNKRVVFVGDSLGKNHWVSLLCLIDSWITEPSHKVAEWHGSLITFRASIESIEKHAKNWVDADILVFDSYTWWLEPNMTLLWGSFENPNRTSIESGRVRRYEMALKTWSNWLDAHLNRSKTRIFFISLSPDHKEGGDWGKAMGENCFNETEPIMEQGYWGKGSDTDLMRTAQSVVQDLEKKGFNIQLLNITQLAQYRKDAHPSLYKRHWVPPTEQELAHPLWYADCVHWCLPGVPDVWNEILYSYIRYKI